MKKFKKWKAVKRVSCAMKDCWSRTTNRKSDDYYEYTYCKEHGDYHRKAIKKLNEKMNREVLPIINRVMRKHLT